MKVADLRTGLTHPTRNGRGQFVSRKDAARQVQILDRATEAIIRRAMENSASLLAIHHSGYCNLPNGSLGFHIRGELNHPVN